MIKSLFNNKPGFFYYIISRLAKITVLGTMALALKETGFYPANIMAALLLSVIIIFSIDAILYGIFYFAANKAYWHSFRLWGWRRTLQITSCLPLSLVFLAAKIKESQMTLCLILSAAFIFLIDFATHKLIEKEP